MQHVNKGDHNTAWDKMFSSHSRDPGRTSVFFCSGLMVLIWANYSGYLPLLFLAFLKKGKGSLSDKMFSSESWLFQIFIFYSHPSIVHVSLNEIMKAAWFAI